MIDPDNIIPSEENTSHTLNINHIPDYDFLTWDLDDEKEFQKYLKAIENEVRKSYEYREFTTFIKNNFDMDQCSFLNIPNQGEFDLRIELHHYPFTLYDITEIVVKKRQYYQESLEVQLAAKEVTMLHYKLIIGLIPLSVTPHQLFHDNKLLIPVDKVLGRYQIFVDMYKAFCSVEQLETLSRIEAYSNPESNLYQSNILDENQIKLQIQDPNYQLPDLSHVEDRMTQRIEEIKENNYQLPTLEQSQQPIQHDTLEDRRGIISPIYFIDHK